MNVICDSRDTAVAYAERLKVAVNLRQVPLPEGYLFAEIHAGQGNFDFPTQPGGDVSISVVPGGEDG